MGNISSILETGFIVTIVGMGIVFAVLILLWGILELMRVYFGKQKKVVPKEIEIKPPVAKPQEDNDELIAVITAAIAASLNTPNNKLKITSIKRVNDNSPIWNKVGRQQVIDNRF